MANKRLSTFQLPAGRRWGEDEAKDVLAAIAASGSTIETFAVEHGLRPGRIQRWRDRLDRARPAVEFHEVAPLEPELGRMSSRTFEVVLHGGLVLRFDVDVAAGRIAAIVRALEESRGC